MQPGRRQAPDGERDRVNTGWRFPEFLSLRGLLFALLGLLALAVAGLLLALVATQPSRPTPEAGRPDTPSMSREAPSGLLSEAAVPDVPGSVRASLVRLPPRPQPARLEALDLLPADEVGDADLRAFLRETDRMIAVLDPSTGYIGLLATQALRNETSRLRVIAESGGTAGALAHIRPVRWTSELPVDAQTLALLLRSILVSSAAGQQILLNSVAGQPAITERIQQAREARALGRLIEIHDALGIGADLRNSVVQSAADDRS